MVRPRHPRAGRPRGRARAPPRGPAGRVPGGGGRGGGRGAGVTREGRSATSAGRGGARRGGGAGTPRDRTSFRDVGRRLASRFDPIVPTAGARRRSRVGIAHLEQDHPRELVVAELAAHELDRGAVPRLGSPLRVRARRARTLARVRAPLVHRATAPLRVVPAPPPELARGLLEPRARLLARARDQPPRDRRRHRSARHGADRAEGCDATPAGAIEDGFRTQKENKTPNSRRRGRKTKRSPEIERLSEQTVWIKCKAYPELASV